jgi:putative Mn2+ efflux pump MntP
MRAVLLIALAVSVDAGAAAVCCGLSSPHFRLRDGVWVGLWFGGFQGGMILLGGLAGAELNEHFTRLGTLVAFGLLLWLGIRMVLDGWQDTGRECAVANLSPRTMAPMAVATSLDALAVGVGVAFLEVPLPLAAAVIGAVTFLISLGGSLAGGKLEGAFRRGAGCVGGVVLILIAVKILLGW